MNGTKNAWAQAYDAKPWLASYVKTTNTTLGELPFRGLDQIPEASARKFGPNKAFSCCLPNGMSGSLTYNQVDLLSDQFASYLRNDLGLAKGDRVAVQTPNCLAQPVASFGILKAGCVLVNVNPLYTEAEMEHQLADSGTKALVIIDMFGDKLTNVVPKTQIRHVITVSIADFFPLPVRALVKLKLHLAKKVPPIRVHAVPFTAALAAGAQSLAAAGPSHWRKNELPTGETPVDPDDVAILQYTGGTTGVAKGAMLTHRNMVGQLQQVTQVAGPEIEPGKEVILTVLPIYHIFAFTFNFLVCYVKGAHNVIVPSPRPMTNLKKPFEKYRFTWMTGVNTLYASLCSEPWFANNPPKHLRVAVAGGAALLSATARRFETIVGKPVYEGYGLTESSPVICVQPLGGVTKPDSIGLPLPGTEVRIVDDNGECVQPGQPGELIARGVQVMLGYWKRPEETAKTLKDGWLYTGDIATMDADGFFRIVDRKKDMILVSGFNVYPNEVEEVIARLQDVAEVCVIGVPDDTTGEAVRAYVVPRTDGLTQDAVKEHCRTYLTGYKVPRKVEFRKELPKSPIGKIIRKDLRVEVLAEFERKASPSADRGVSASV